MRTVILDALRERQFAPWGETTEPTIRVLSDAVGCQAFALGLFDARRPRVDEVLVHSGVADNALARWCAAGPPGEDARLLREAVRKGVGAGHADDAAASLFGRSSLLAVAVPHNLPRRRWWWMLLAKRDAFTDRDAAVASLILRETEARFKRPDEPGLGRVLLGHDDRLLAADLRIEDMMLSEPDAVAGLPAIVRPILTQRWPKLADRQTRDVVIPMDGGRVRIDICRGRAVPSESAVHWYLELRPADEGDLPPVGLVQDERIARAIAYLHTEFAHAPSLAMIARQVHMSPFHFHRLFTRHVSMSPKQYLLRKQLQTAKWLLRSSRTAIGAIAQETGFSSHGHFTSTFHRVVGVSPSQYREQH
jgi:AraC-like DNA-binding protein